MKKTFTQKALEVAEAQALYWLQNGNDAEEVAQWLNIVFALEDRLIPPAQEEETDE